MIDAFCGFLTLTAYTIVAAFWAIVAFFGSVIALCLGAGLLGAILYGCGIVKDDNTRPTENTREW